ncbi:uncharacterized protein DS421_9g274200 [Arachis hypogaea]|nr:uncharacterized protein DS421_9g274200 [Arachis hypogaea]
MRSEVCISCKFFSQSRTQSFSRFAPLLSVSIEPVRSIEKSGTKRVQSASTFFLFLKASDGWSTSFLKSSEDVASESSLSPAASPTFSIKGRNASNNSSITSLTQNLPHLFAKSRSTVVKSHLVCWLKLQ